eukprot:TRINITY_DN64648_c0_g1_i1.p1 TRINITY_DN64648_c0_g1~~TRINITY_DN64648_c0_g1_i1.p1  ORF type:complete len:422 (+),score=67.29 TRINITY_DN64648_c0_g1_i1:2239-3504(+)
MVLHGLNPLVELKCKLSTTLVQIIERLRQYISKGGSIDSIIGYKNEIKIAPEIELIKNNPKKRESTEDPPKDPSEDHRVIVWTENTAKGLVLDDVYNLLRVREPLFLYYYWDEVPPSENGTASHYYYHTQKSKDEILGRKEYEDFIEMVANVVQNVLTKKKKQRGRGKRKRTLPELTDPPKPPEPVNDPAKEESKVRPASDLVIDMEKPFKSLFDKPKPHSSETSINKKTSFEENNEKLIGDSLIDDTTLQRKKKCIVPTYDSLLQQSDSEKNSRPLPAVGSAANSMRIPLTQSNGIYSSMPLFDISEIFDMDKGPDTEMAFVGANKVEESGEVRQKPEEYKKDEYKRVNKKASPKKVQQKIQQEDAKKQEKLMVKLPHPNEAFKMCQRGKISKGSKTGRGEEGIIEGDCMIDSKKHNVGK